MNKAVVEIQNLKCGGCEAQIRDHLTKIPGIKKVEVRHEESSVRFIYDNLQNLNTAKTKLKELGYPPTGAINSLTSKAKSYVSCLIGRTK